MSNPDQKFFDIFILVIGALISIAAGQVALPGDADTPPDAAGYMPPQGGRVDLSDDEVRSAVDYIVTGS